MSKTDHYQSSRLLSVFWCQSNIGKDQKEKISGHGGRISRVVDIRDQWDGAHGPVTAQVAGQQQKP